MIPAAMLAGVDLPGEGLNNLCGLCEAMEFLKH